MSSPYKLNISVDKIEVEKYRPKDIVCMNEWSLKGAKLYFLLFTINKNNITIKICSQFYIFVLFLVIESYIKCNLGRTIRGYL